MNPNAFLDQAPYTAPDAGAIVSVTDHERRLLNSVQVLRGPVLSTIAERVGGPVDFRVVAGSVELVEINDTEAA